MGKRRIIIIEEDDNSPVRFPNPYEGLNEPFNGMINDHAVDPCMNCQNNPKNNPAASGVCCCALPDMYRIRYGTAMPVRPAVTTTIVTTTNTLNGLFGEKGGING